MKSILLALLAPCMILCASYGDKAPPDINPNFVVYTTETDSTNATILEQKLVFDIDLKRSMMYGQGSLVHGAIQQIRRCDIHPEGWMSSSGGPNIEDPSTWTCTNTTISRRGELPNNCQYSTFWSFPADMKYMGPDEVNGAACDRWEYLSGGDLYALWATAITSDNGDIYDAPVANGKIGSVSGDSEWMIYYKDFVPGSPPEAEYDAVEECDCPESTPP